MGLSHCDRIKQQEEVRQIEGYWEIESVQVTWRNFQPKGAAPSVDYYFFPVTPQGSKKTKPTNDWTTMKPQKIKSFCCSRRKRVHVAFHFQTPLESWKEEIKRDFSRPIDFIP